MNTNNIRITETVSKGRSGRYISDYGDVFKATNGDILNNSLKVLLRENPVFISSDNH